MEKEFVPYKQALALKELGFDEPCFAFYFRKEIIGMTAINTFKEDSECLKAPTFSQAFRWFREKYNLFCEIQIDRTSYPKFCFNIFQYEHFGNYENIEVKEWYLFRSHEEAELECLKKLIETIKERN